MTDLRLCCSQNFGYGYGFHGLHEPQSQLISVFHNQLLANRTAATLHLAPSCTYLALFRIALHHFAIPLSLPSTTPGDNPLPPDHTLSEPHRIYTWISSSIDLCCVLGISFWSPPWGGIWRFGPQYSEKEKSRTHLPFTLYSTTDPQQFSTFVTISRNFADCIISIIIANCFNLPDNLSKFYPTDCPNVSVFSTPGAHLWRMWSSIVWPH